MCVPVCSSTCVCVSSSIINFLKLTILYDNAIIGVMEEVRNRECINWWKCWIVIVGRLALFMSICNIVCWIAVVDKVVLYRVVWNIIWYSVLWVDRELNVNSDLLLIPKAYGIRRGKKAKTYTEGPLFIDEGQTPLLSLPTICMRWDNWCICRIQEMITLLTNNNALV